MEGFRDADGATFACLNGVFGDLRAIEAQRNDVHPGGNLNARGRDLVGGNAVDKDGCALRSGIHLRPGDVYFLLRFQVDVEGGLNIVLDLNVAGIRVVAGHAQHEVVLTRAEWKSGGSLTALLGAVDEDIRARGKAGNVEAFGDRFEM